MMPILAKPAIIWTALVYLSLVVVIGIWAARRTRNAKDFFIAGQGIGLARHRPRHHVRRLQRIRLYRRSGADLPHGAGLAVHLHPGELHRRPAVLGGGQTAAASRRRARDLHRPRRHLLPLSQPAGVRARRHGRHRRHRGLSRGAAQGPRDPDRVDLRHPRVPRRVEPRRRRC